MSRKAITPDYEKVREALEAAHGIQSRAAEILGVARTSLQSWLRMAAYEGLDEYSRELRRQYAPPTFGRPWHLDGARSREAVERAWNESGYRLNVAARMLDLPRNSLRHLLHRYQLPNLPASGRPAKPRR
jgi:transcriptional regulator with GAF, ATPase, and Fis domain